MYNQKINRPLAENFKNIFSNNNTKQPYVSVGAKPISVTHSIYSNFSQFFRHLCALLAAIAISRILEEEYLLHEQKDMLSYGMIVFGIVCFLVFLITLSDFFFL
jgi:hypothetical protein